MLIYENDPKVDVIQTNYTRLVVNMYS